MGADSAISEVWHSFIDVPIPRKGIDLMTSAGDRSAMKPITNQIAIEVSADEVWETIGHRFDRVSDWSSAIRASTASGRSGRVCSLSVPFFSPITETITDFDEAQRVLTYEAIAGLPPGITHARNTWTVTAVAPGRCRVAFSAAVEAPNRLARKLFHFWAARLGRKALEDLKHHLEVGSLPTSALLRAALRANAVFSMLTGCVLVALGWSAGQHWGVPPATVPAIGAGVVAFGVLVARAAVEQGESLRRQARLVVAADLLWVVASGALIVLSAPAGAGVIGAIAAVVAGVAVIQMVGINRSSRSDPLSDVEVVELSRNIDAGTAFVFDAMSDHDLYGKIAPNLKAVEVTSAPGQRLERRCTSVGGKSWDETCTLWEAGHRFAVEVDTSNYPYPLLQMRGLWQVDPDTVGSRVTMRFEYRAARSLWGGLFTIALRVAFPIVLRRIVAGWRARAVGLCQPHNDVRRPNARDVGPPKKSNGDRFVCSACCLRAYCDVCCQFDGRRRPHCA